MNLDLVIRTCFRREEGGKKASSPRRLGLRRRLHHSKACNDKAALRHTSLRCRIRACFGPDHRDKETSLRDYDEKASLLCLPGTPNKSTDNLIPDYGPAADDVFNIPELLENILDRLSALDVLRAQRVSRAFRATVSGSQSSNASSL